MKLPYFTSAYTEISADAIPSDVRFEKLDRPVAQRPAGFESLPYEPEIEVAYSHAEGDTYPTFKRLVDPADGSTRYFRIGIGR